MKTDPQVMAAVLRKAADNVENGVDWNVGIEYQRANGTWQKPVVIGGEPDYIMTGALYRIAPETITLQNGVTIPKPLSEEELLCCDDNNKFIPCANALGYVKVPLYRVCDRGHGEIVYKTKEEAIEASKALFT